MTESWRPTNNSYNSFNEQTSLLRPGELSDEFGYVTWIKLFIWALFFVGLIYFVLIIFPRNTQILETDLTQIPLNYQLRVTSYFPRLYNWDYAIEEISSSSSSHLECRRESIHNSWNNTRNTTQPRFLNARIVPRTYNLWKPFDYTIQEQHYDDEGNLTLYSTGNAYITDWFWPNPSIVSKFEGEKKPDSKEACEYKITLYNFVMNGWVMNRCGNFSEKDDWTIISWVERSLLWDMEFYDPKGKVQYAVATRAFYDWDGLPKRHVHLCEDAPFPAAIPAIYSIFSDYSINKKNAERGRRDRRSQNEE